METNENDKMTSDVFGEKVKKMKFVLKKNLALTLNYCKQKKAKVVLSKTIIEEQNAD